MRNSDVTISFNCTDTGSGVASCPADMLVARERFGQVISVTATGNSGTLQITLNNDTTGPMLTVDSPTKAERVFGLLPPVTVEGTAFDSLSVMVSLTCGRVD